MCRRDVVSRLARGLTRGKGTNSGRRDGPLDDLSTRRVGASEAAPEHFLLSRNTRKIGWASLGEGGRAERPLKIRNAHVEQAQAKPRSSLASTREGKPAPALAGRNGNLTMELPIPSPRAPAVTVATTRFFFVCPVRPQSRQHRRAGLGSTRPACWVPTAPRYLPTCLTSAEVYMACVHCMCACVPGVPACGALAARCARPRAEGKKTTVDYLQGAITSLASVASHTRSY